MLTASQPRLLTCASTGSEERKLLQSWRAHADTIYGFACSADHTKLATASGDKLIKVWEIATGKELSQLEGHSAQVLAVAFNSNATQVASSGADKDLKVWDIQSRQKIALWESIRLKSRTQWPEGGKTIFAGTDAGTILAYSNLKPHAGTEGANSGEERKVATASDSVLCVAANSETNLFVGTHSGKVHVYNKDGKLLGTLTPEASRDTASPSPAVSVSNARKGLIKTTSAAAKTKPAAKVETTVVDFKPNAVVSLSAAPNEVHLSSSARHHGVLISARLANGFEVDATGAAKYSVSKQAPFEVTGWGQLRALRPGKGVLTARLGKSKVEIPVVVEYLPRTKSPTNSALPR